MALDVKQIADKMRFTLGGLRDLPPVLDPIAVTNEIGEFLTSLQQWYWLTTQTAKLSLVKNVPYLRLPVHFPDTTVDGAGVPDTPIRSLVAAEAGDSLVNSLTLTSHKQLLELRTQQIHQDGPNYWGAINYIPDDTENLLLYTEDLSGDSGVWTSTNNATATANGREDPFTGEKTISIVADADGAATSSLSQLVQRHLTPDGDYEYSCVMAPDNTDESQVHIMGFNAAGVGVTTAVEIDWTTTPYTVTRSGADTAGTTHSWSYKYLRDGFLQLTVAVTHAGSSGSVNNGLSVLIFPATTTSAETGNVYVGRCQVTRKRIHPHATGYPDGPAPYVPNYAATYRVGGPPIPVIDIWPVPTTSVADKFLIEFAAGWPTVRNETDILAIPNWLQSWMLEAAQTWARGINEEDKMTLSARLSNDLVGGFDRYGRPQNLLLALAMQRDAEMQTDVGRIEGGATGSAGPWKDWGSNATVGGPV